MGAEPGIEDEQDNSGEAGLVGPAPFFGVWMILAVLQVWRYRRWAPEGAGR